MFRSPVSVLERELHRVRATLEYLNHAPVLGVMLLTIVGVWLWGGFAVADNQINAVQALILFGVVAGLALLLITGTRSLLLRALIMTFILHYVSAWMQYCLVNPYLGLVFVLGVSFAGSWAGPLGAGTAALVGGVWQIVLWPRLFAHEPPMTLALVLGTNLLAAVIASLASASQQGALEISSNAVRDAQRRLEQLRSSRGELNRTIHTLDLTTARLERANAELSRARRLAEEAQHFKDELAARISHELRTPLNLILGFSETIAFNPEAYGADLPTPYRRDVLDIYRVGRHMLSLIEDILDLARLQAGRLGIYLEDADLSQVVTTAVEIVQPLIESKHLALHVELPETAPQVRIDQARIRQVVLNLLSNAARFTRHGGIMVCLQVSEGEAIVSVTDTGPGIAPEQMHRVFAEYQQLDGSTRREHEGAGLGLAISKELVELHGGRMWVESKVGEGSTFSFALPLSGATPISRLTAGLAAGAAGDVSPAVLVLSTPSHNLAGLLQRHMPRYQIAAVRDWEEAARRARQGDVRALITDGPPATAAPSQLPLPVLSCSFEPLNGRVELPAGVLRLLKPVSGKGLRRLLAELPHPAAKILLVSEYAETLRVLTRMLSAHLGTEVVIAQALDLASARERCRSLAPDLVLVDLDSTQDEIGSEAVATLQREYAPAHCTFAAVMWSSEEGPIRGGPMVLTTADGLTLSDYFRYVEAILDVTYPRDDGPLAVSPSKPTEPPA